MTQSQARLNTDPPRYWCPQCGGRIDLDGRWVSCRTCTLSIADRRYLRRGTRLRVTLAAPTWWWWAYMSPLRHLTGISYRALARLAHRFGRHYSRSLLPDGTRRCNWCGHCRPPRKDPTRT